jgi:hypothetical protein
VGLYLDELIRGAAHRMHAEQRLTDADFEEARQAFRAVFTRAAETAAQREWEWVDEEILKEAINGICPGLWPVC